MRKQDQQDLVHSLMQMHSHNVVHLDINPDNIMFSPYHKAAVFIDFGMSKVIAEEKGYKSLITFHGTPNYVSPEMLKLISIDD